MVSIFNINFLHMPLGRFTSKAQAAIERAQKYGYGKKPGRDARSPSFVCFIR